MRLYMMTNIDYSIFYKYKFDKVEDIPSQYDLFISAYNESDRVNEIFLHITSTDKHWLILPEYCFTEDMLPKSGKLFTFEEGQREDEIIRNYLEKVGFDFIQNRRICIDITGFIRPHLVFFIRILAELNVKTIDFLYTDPIKYSDQEKTLFSGGKSIPDIIAGCGGNPNPIIDNDILIVGAGYDYQRINDIVIFKPDAKLVQVFGFPSLKADMYQENILRASEVTDIIWSRLTDSNYSILSPANDPFITAKQIQEFVKKENAKKSITNLYLCPLSTKAQTLGFALFYITECINKAVSIIFPFCETYSRETTEGISKIWIYTVEFDTIKKWNPTE